MDVTFLAPVPDMSGGARVNDIYARALAKRGHRVTVVVVPRPRRTLRRTVGDFVRRRPPVSTATHFSGDGYRLKYLERCRPIRADDLPPSDIVVATWWETARWLIDMPDTVGVKAHLVQGYEAFTDEMKPHVHEVLRAPTVKITISRWLRDKLRDEFGNQNVDMVLNGVDLAQFHAPPRGRQAAFTVGTLYNGQPSKNTRLSFALFEALRTTHPDARLVTLGLQAVSPELPLPAGATHFQAPAQDRIREVYAQCDLWLCCSRSEGFHLPPLEAMACRCPVLSTPVGGPQDIVVDGVNGYLFPFDDFESGLRLLTRIADTDEATWRALSDGAYATAIAASWDAAADQVEQALQRAVDRAGRPAG